MNPGPPAIEPAETTEDPVEFDLVDRHGLPVTARTYRGRWLMVQFGFDAVPADRIAADVLDLAGRPGSLTTQSPG